MFTTKSDTIDAIRKLNPSAEPEFLSGFPREELARYLERLSTLPTAGRVYSGRRMMIEEGMPEFMDESGGCRAPTE